MGQEPQFSHSGDTVSGRLDNQPRKRVVWDLTINLGHVISFTMGLIAVVGIYYSLDSRVSRQEYMIPIEAKARAEKDANVQSSLTALSTDLKDVKTVVDKVSRAIEVQAAVNEAKEKRK